MKLKERRRILGKVTAPVTNEVALPPAAAKLVRPNLFILNLPLANRQRGKREVGKDKLRPRHEGVLGAAPASVSD